MKELQIKLLQEKRNVKEEDRIRRKNMYQIDIKAGTARDISAIFNELPEGIMDTMSFEDLLELMTRKLIARYSNRYGDGDGFVEQLKRKGILSTKDAEDQIYFWIRQHEEKLQLN